MWPAPLTVGEVAAELGCSEDEIRALIRDDELQKVACGIRPGLIVYLMDGYGLVAAVATGTAVAVVVPLILYRRARRE